jgi:hypothetical protein
MFPETASVLKQEEIIPFHESDCIGNKALFLLIGSCIDKYFQHAIQGFEGHGDKTLQFIKAKYANVSADDTHHLHHLFTTIRIKGRVKAPPATSVGSPLGRQRRKGLAICIPMTPCALAGLCNTKNPKYDTAAQLFQLECNGRKTFTLEDLKKSFSADKKHGRDQALTRLATGHVATGYRRGHSDHGRTTQRRPASANAAITSSNP